jgi:hypothetical protein
VHAHTGAAVAIDRLSGLRREFTGAVRIGSVGRLVAGDHRGGRV